MNENVEQLLLKASYHYNHAEYCEAELIYRNILSSIPNQPDSLHGVGVIALKNGKMSIAINYLLRAVKQISKIEAPKPLIAIFVGNLARAYQLSGDFVTVSEYFKHSLNFHYNQQVVNWLNELQGKVGGCNDFDSSITSEQNLPTSSEENSHSLLNFNEIIEFHRKGELSIAESGYRKILSQNPKNSDALHLLGVLTHQKGDSIAAENLIRKALNLFSEPIYWSNLGLVLNEQRRYNEALIAADNALQQKTNFFEAINVKAVALQALGRFDEAELQYKKVLNHTPDNPDILNALGVVAIAQKEYNKAVDYTKKAIMLRENFPEAWNNQGNALAKLKRYEEAEICYRTALIYKPDFVEVILNLGHKLNTTGNFEDALILVGYHKNWDAASCINISYEFRLIAAISLRCMGKWQESLQISRTVIDQLLPIGEERFSSLRLGVNGAICAYILSDIELCHRILDWSASIHVSNNLNDKNFKIYHDYLVRLLDWRNQNKAFYLPEDNNDNDRIFIIGESHCLSPARLKFSEKCIIEPRLVMGAKAYHIAEKIKQYWRSLKFVTADIPQKAKVIFVFGEIDCRIDEGILKFFKHKEIKNKEQFIINLVNKYVEVLDEQIRLYHWIAAFQSVPFPNFMEREVSPIERQDLIDVIMSFNKILKYKVELLGHKFLDVYTLTKNTNWYIDGHHLLPSYLLSSYVL